LVDDLQTGGAVAGDIGARARWHIAGGYRKQYHSGLRGMLMTRPFLEWQIRRRVVALPTITVLHQCSVEHLLTTPDRTSVTGVGVVHHGDHERMENIPAALVIDAAGRGSHTPQWLDALGYGRPTEQTIKNDVSYATCLYRRQPGDTVDADIVIVSSEPPHGKRAALALAIEGDRWIVALNGVAGERTPTDDAGFAEWLHSLAAPDVYNLVRHLEPISPVAMHTFPRSIWRHYEKLARFPNGYLVLGDAICSFNPIYGQGITSAALQALALDEILAQHGPAPGLWKRFFTQAARIVDVPWQQTAGADFAYPETEGARSRVGTLIGAYMWRVQRATHHDPVVYGAFLRVINLVAPPTTLFAPRIVARVLVSSLGRRPNHLRKTGQIAQPAGGE
jgi:2-polyprenyl-6-methoxyphenol hydroxylase-like FAD-dependent oxidoreductase